MAMGCMFNWNLKQRHYCVLFHSSSNQSDDLVISWSINHQHYNALCCNCPCYKNLTDWGLNLLAWDHLIMLENVIIERYWSPVMFEWCLFQLWTDWQTAAGTWTPSPVVSTRRLLITQHSHMLTLSVQISSYTLTPLCWPYYWHISGVRYRYMYISSPFSYVYTYLIKPENKTRLVCPVFSRLAKYSSSLSWN